VEARLGIEPEATKAQLDHVFRMRVLLLIQQIGRYASFCLIAYPLSGTLPSLDQDRPDGRLVA
jgi:hypothetical protein